MTPNPGGARAVARLGAILLLVGIVALGAVALRDVDDGAAVVATDLDEGEAHRSWEVPDAVDLAVVGDDVWLLSKPEGDAYSLSRFDERTGELSDRRALDGSALSMTSAGDHLWLWGEVRSAEVQAVLDSGSRELPTTGRVGIVHRVDTGVDGDARTWDLGPTVPILLVAEADRAWSYAVDAATFLVPSLVHLGGRRDGDADPLGDRGDAYSFVLDGDRLLVDDLSALLVIDRDTGEIIDRREPRRLRGRTADGRVWADVGMVLSFRVTAIDDGTVLHGSGNIATVAGGIAVGTRWFDEPDDDSEVDAVLDEVRDAIYLHGPEPLGEVAYYLETQQSVDGPPARLHRWSPRHDERVPPEPRADLPSELGSGDCEPLVAGFLSDDSGDWAESAVEDDDVPGAVRRRGPEGSSVLAVPGPAPWITDVAGAEERPPPESFRSLHLVRIPEGFAAQAVPADSPREAPCDAVTVLGYGVSADELRSQIGLAGTAQHADRTPP